MTWVLTLQRLSAMTSVSSGAPSARLLARADVARPVDPALALAPPPGVERWAPVEATLVLAQF